MRGRALLLFLAAVSAAISACLGASLTFARQPSSEKTAVSAVLYDLAARLDGPPGDRGEGPAFAKFVTPPEEEFAFSEGKKRDGSPTARRVIGHLTCYDAEALAVELRERIDGVDVIAVDPKRRFVDAWLPLDSLQTLEDMARPRTNLRGVTPVRKPVAFAGSVTAQGDFLLQTARLRAENPNAGNGTVVGILSDSFNYLGDMQDGIDSGDLPADVEILHEIPGGFVGTDEGRAMAEIVHDMAPLAFIFFATAYATETNFAQNIRNLRDAGCHVIVDDIQYLGEPMYQHGIVAQAVQEVYGDGVAYFSAAGNSAPTLGWEIVGDDIDFQQVSVNSESRQALNWAGAGATFDPLQRFVLAPNQRLVVMLHWDDPYYADNVQTDLDLHLVFENAIVTSSAGNNMDDDLPFESFEATNSLDTAAAVDLLVLLTDGRVPGRIRYTVLAGPGPSEHVSPAGTINPHGAVSGGMAVGAVAYFAQGVHQSYTAGGPSVILFDEDGNRLDDPLIVDKPDMAAVDGVDTTFFGQALSDGNSFPNFFGTSAAAPAAAAVAAVVLGANPGIDVDEVYQRMTSTARPGISHDPLRLGAGVVDAWRAALQADAEPVADPGALQEGFEQGYAGVSWELNFIGGKAFGRAASAQSPLGGSYHLLLSALSDFQTTTYGLVEAILHLDLSEVDVQGAQAFTLHFSQREFNDEDHPMPSTFSGSGDYDGVAISVDGGNSWRRLVSLTGSISQNSYRGFAIDLVEFAQNAGIAAFPQDTRIKFQQYGNRALPNDGFAFDEIFFDNSTDTTNLPADDDDDELSGSAALSSWSALF